MPPTVHSGQAFSKACNTAELIAVNSLSTSTGVLTWPIHIPIRELSSVSYFNQSFVVGHFERKFQEKWGVAHQQLLVSEICRVPAPSHGTVCVILRLAVLTQYWHVTDTQTHDDG